MDQKLVNEAFGDRPELLAHVNQVVTSPKSDILAVLVEVSKYVVSLKQDHTSRKRSLDDAGKEEPLTKKRKIPHQTSEIAHKANNAEWGSVLPWYSLQRISFSIPLRRKLTLEIVRNGYTSAPHGIRAVGANGVVEASISWKDVAQVMCLPVPEKVLPLYNFIIIPVSSTDECIMWTVPGSAARNPIRLASAVRPNGTNIIDVETDEELMQQLLDTELAFLGKAVVRPEAKEFVSSVVQSHRKGEESFAVKSFTGSKEGFLYFLSTGILFGFKKPVLFFPFSTIDSIFYSSVLQRTFNLNINAHDNVVPATNLDYEFSMLDQADFAGIDTYVKRHGLHDASLAESRRATQNGSKGGASASGVLTEQPAQGLDADAAEKALQDAEDAEEEDYEEDGSDDGSGSSEDEYEDDVDAALEDAEESLKAEAAALVEG